MTTETPFFFEGDAGALFGLLHEPSAGAPARTEAFVFCHPFAEEKLWTHRTYVTMARALAGRGYPVLRFDCRGNGDSDGAFPDFSLSGALDDVARAVDTVRARTGATAVSLLGLRLGGTVAALSAERLAGIARLVLWAPVVDGSRYMQEQLRVNLATQLAVYKEIRQDRNALVADLQAGATVNIDGYQIAWPLFQQLSEIKLTASPRPFAGPCLIIQVDRVDGAKPTAEMEQLRGAYAHGSLALVREEPFWKEIEAFYERAPRLFDSTLAWLEAA
jgi:exosortase A-associated hydrolase 2